MSLSSNFTPSTLNSTKAWYSGETGESPYYGAYLKDSRDAVVDNRPVEPTRVFIFDGVNDSLQAISKNGLAGAQYLSGSAKIKAVNYTQINVLGVWGASDYSWSFWVSNNRLFFNSSPNGSTYYQISSTGTITNNTLYTLGFVYNINAGTLQFYVDGVAFEELKSGLNNTLHNSNLPLMAGANMFGLYVTGSMSDIRLFNVIKTPNEMLNLHNGGEDNAGLIFSPQPALTSGHIIPDYSPQGNHALLVNGTDIGVNPSFSSFSPFNKKGALPVCNYFSKNYGAWATEQNVTTSMVPMTGMIGNVAKRIQNANLNNSYHRVYGQSIVLPYGKVVLYFDDENCNKFVLSFDTGGKAIWDKATSTFNLSGGFTGVTVTSFSGNVKKAVFTGTSTAFGSGVLSVGGVNISSGSLTGIPTDTTGYLDFVVATVPENWTGGIALTNGNPLPLLTSNPIPYLYPVSGDTGKTILGESANIGEQGNSISLAASHCLTLDGTNDYIELVGSRISDSNSDTIEFYMYSHVNTPNYIIDDAGAGGIGIYTYNGYVYLQIAGSITSYGFYGFTSVTDSKWHYVKIQRTGAAAPYGRVWIDGVETKNTSTHNVAPTRTVNPWIGSNGSYRLNGRIANVKITNGGTVKLQLPMAEGAGTICYDTSGNNNHATLINGVSWANSQDVYHKNYMSGCSIAPSLLHSGAGSGWNAAADSTFSTSGDITTSTLNIGGVYLFGLKTGTGGTIGLTYINYCVYIDRLNSTVQIWESGNLQGTFACDKNSKITISRIGTTISYTINGAVVRTVANVTSTLYVSCVVHKAAGTTLFSATINNDYVAWQNFVQCSAVNVKLPAKNEVVDIYDIPIKNKIGYVHNGSETKLKAPETNEILNCDASNYWFNSSYVPNQKAYADLVSNVASANKIFCNVTTANKRQDLTLCNPALSGGDLSNMTDYTSKTIT
jgi:hypothetical protein